MGTVMVNAMPVKTGCHKLQNEVIWKQASLSSVIIRPFIRICETLTVPTYDV